MESIEDSLMRLILMYGALQFGDFTLSSGKKSDVYCDLRQITLRHDAMALVGYLLWFDIKHRGIQAVGGMSLGADPIVTTLVNWYDYDLDVSAEDYPHMTGFLIRKEAKEHGVKGRLVGPSIEGKKVVIVEDVTTTGHSAMDAVKVAQEAGAQVELILSILDREDGAYDLFEKNDLEFAALLSLDELREYAGEHPELIHV